MSKKKLDDWNARPLSQKKFGMKVYQIVCRNICTVSSIPGTAGYFPHSPLILHKYISYGGPYTFKYFCYPVIKQKMNISKNNVLN